MLTDPAEIGKVFLQCTDLTRKAENAAGNVADNFLLGEIDIIDGRRIEIDVNDLAAIVFHEKRRLFDNVMTDVDDQVGPIDSTMDIIVFGKRRRAEEPGVVLINHDRPDIIYLWTNKIFAAI